MNPRIAAIETNRRPRRIGSRRKSLERGQTLTEFALVSSAFLSLTFSIVWMGMAVYAYSFVSYGAREGSRYAAVHGSDSAAPVTTSAAVSTFVQNETAGLDTSKLTVSTTWSPSATPGQAGGTVQVQVQYNFRLPIPLISTITLPLSSTSKMTIS